MSRDPDPVALEGGLHRFVHRTRPLEVRFGAGRVAEAGSLLETCGIRRALVVSTRSGMVRAVSMLEALGEGVAGRFDGARVHVPEPVVTEALRVADHSGADGYLAVGGGSAIGVAKAMALETGAPMVAVPTTYSGSEMTHVWGVTSAGGKRTGRDDRVAPRGVIYDPELLAGLPSPLGAESGVNALAHAVEALYAPDRTPLSTLLAEEGIRALGEGLPGLLRRPEDLTHPSTTLRGAHLAGWALDLTTMGLQHKLAHVLGGTFDLPHARVHAILLPHVVAWNGPAAPGAMRRLVRALGGDGATEGEGSGVPRGAAALERLNDRVGIPRSLAHLELDRGALEQVADLALEAPYANPRPVTRDGVREILESAWSGRSYL